MEFKHIKVLPNDTVTMLELRLMATEIMSICVEIESKTVHLGYNCWILFDISNNTIAFEGTDEEQEMLEACKTFEQLIDVVHILRPISLY